MAKNYSNRNRKRKALIAMLCALSVTCTGLAAACEPTEESEKPSTAVTAKEDTQLLKNGNFEHFDIPDKAIHLIKNANSWSLSGDTSVKSGIISTSKSEWDKLVDPELSDTLDYNNDLSTSNENYVNYNSMRSRDILYKDTYSAMLKAEDVDGSWITRYYNSSNGGAHGYQGYFDIKGAGTDDDPYTWNGETAKLDDGEFYIADENGEFNKLIRKELIENPGTHYDLSEDESKVTVDGTNYDVFKDENSGSLYYKKGDEEVHFSNVLMLHNGSTDTDNHSIQQYYSSNTITLEAHTSAEISLWVKTSDLRFNKGHFADEGIDIGAYIEVVQTVAGTTLDSFKIKAINTQNINTTSENNGWVQYTVYVNACDFANTSIQLKLGLGGSEQHEKITGYAFFDDVQVTKYRDLSADDNYDASKVTNTTCYLTSDEDKKIFYAESDSFHYLVDLASVMKDEGNKHSYSPIDFDSNNVAVGLTTEKDSKGVEYAAAKNFEATVNGVGSKSQNNLNIPKDVKARPTDEDIIKILASGDTFTGAASILTTLVEKGAPELLDGNNGNTLVMFSAWGAPYTATISDSAFTLNNDKGNYLLVSFWVKTNDMKGDTAATVKIYEYELDKEGKATKNINEESVQTLSIDTTDKTTDFEDDKDIYSGWVQCFFFVKNDTDAERTFNIDFSFGTTAITTTTSYASGYAAIANLQALEINEDIYKLASAGDTTALFSFAKDATTSGGKPFDEATTGANSVNEGIASPDSYTVANGKNVEGALYNKQNAGLINRDVFNDENGDYPMADADKIAILQSFMAGATTWDEVFGKNCYQPLIIINSLRQYAEKAVATESTFENYYILLNDDSTETAGVITVNGKKYKSATGTTYSEDETYYSLEDVVNYGFIGSDKTVSANSSELISVRVKVTGNAVAYIYLVDTNDTSKILSYTTPAYTYWYDEEGNVLDEEFNEDWTTAEHRAHIAYTLREDGLYDGKDGKLYGNLHNLVKSYKDSKYENVEYYYEDGTPVEGGYDYVEKHDGETFYKTSEGKNGQIADHYLCATDGTHVYEYINGKYYYVEITKKDGKTTETTNKNLEVNYFDTTPRYTKPDIDETLYATVTADDCKLANGLCDKDGWVTVNFVIKTDSAAKNYRLELWSGARNATVDEGYTLGANDAVAFDYSRATVSDDRLGEYEAEIVNAYYRAIIEVQNAENAGKPEEEQVDLLDGLPTGTKAKISSFEKLLAGLDEEYRNQIYAKLANPEYGGYVELVDGKYVTTYTASYYTYTLYDSAAYVPFNATTAGDGETGYDYDASSFEETLAYFEFDDVSRHQKNVFVDYTPVDHTISKNTADSGNDSGDDDTKTSSAELGLYISSIVLVVVLLITLVSILITQYVKKSRKAKGVKNSSKNVYRKRDRYVKKLHLVKDEMIEPESSESETNEATEAPAEEVTPIENEVTEIPAEETAEPDGEDKE